MSQHSYKDLIADIQSEIIHVKSSIDTVGGCYEGGTNTADQIALEDHRKSKSEYAERQTALDRDQTGTDAKASSSEVSKGLKDLDTVISTLERTIQSAKEKMK